MTINEMIQKSREIQKQMRDLNDLSHSEKRAFTPDEEVKWDRMNSDQDEWEKKIERARQLKDLETKAVSDLDSPPGDPNQQELNYDDVFLRYCRNRRGFIGLTDEEQRLLQPGDIQLRGTNTQITSTDSLGGYLVPDQWASMIEQTMLYFGGMMEAAEIITTAQGGTWRLPTLNDTANVGAIIGQGVDDEVSDLTYGETVLDEYTYTSKEIKVAWEQMNDSAYSMSDHINKTVGERIGRILNTHFTVGDGSGKPTGIGAASGGSSAGKTAASATAIAFDELMDLEHSVDIAYRKAQKVAWMFHDSTLKALKKLKDQNDLYLWQGATTSGEPSTILGYPYFVNNDVAEIATTAKTIYFGDWSKYVIRRVKGIELIRLEERYANARAVGFFAWARYGGKLVNTAAIKHLVQA